MINVDIDLNNRFDKYINPSDHRKYHWKELNLFVDEEVQ